MQSPLFYETGEFRVTSQFGVDRITHKHGGVDGVRLLNGQSLTAWIRAVGDGTITNVITHVKGVSTKTGETSGNMVEVFHGNGIYTRYKHLAHGTITAKMGDKVKKGELLGYMGNTGNSNGAHIHFEWEVNKELKNGLDIAIGKMDVQGSDIVMYPFIKSELNHSSDGIQETRDLQYLLNKKYGFDLVEDGNFGSLTEKALKKFQELVGIEQTGITDIVTRQYLNSDYFKLYTETYKKLKELKGMIDNVVRYF